MSTVDEELLTLPEHPNSSPVFSGDRAANSLVCCGLCFVDHCLSIFLCPLYCQRPSCSWPYGSWIYSYLCNQWLLPLTLWVRIPLMRGVLDTTLCGKICQWLWFPPPKKIAAMI